MPRFPYGNDPAKIERYRAFWERRDTARPLVGFTLVGWFPLGEFTACRAWAQADYLEPEMVQPQDFIGDHLRVLREGEVVDDDLIRGASPALVTIPWLPAMLGARLRILPENVLGEERKLPWSEALAARLDPEHPWYRKYMEFAAVLASVSEGQFPVSQSAEVGPTDLHALVRGHTESLLDYSDEPEKSQELLYRMADIFRDFTQQTWQQVPLYHGGYFDAQYSLWSPGPIARMQEDATAVYSPRLYRRFVQPVDRALARHFASAFIHLHSTSMFLLDAILEIEEIRCYEINNDAIGPPLAKLIPYLQMVQKAGKPLLVRGSFTPDEMRLLMDSLAPEGLFLNVMVRDLQEVEALRPLVGM